MLKIEVSSQDSFFHMFFCKRNISKTLTSICRIILYQPYPIPIVVVLAQLIYKKNTNRLTKQTKYNLQI